LGKHFVLWLLAFSSSFPCLAQTYPEPSPSPSPVRNPEVSYELDMGYPFHRPTEGRHFILPWADFAVRAVIDAWMWPGSHRRTESSVNWISSSLPKLPERLSEYTDQGLTERYTQHRKLYEEAWTSRTQPGPLLSPDQLKRASFYVATLSIASEYVRTSNLSTTVRDQELNQFLFRIGKTLSFEEKTELASTLAGTLYINYDQDRSRFQTKGIRELPEMLSRLAAQESNTGICGDIVLATNQLLLAMDPNLKRNVFTMSFVVGGAQHIVSLILDPSEAGTKSRKIKILNYDEVSDYEAGRDFWTDVFDDSTYQGMGIQTRLFDAIGNGLAEMPTDHLRFFAKLLGPDSMGGLGLPSGTLENLNLNVANIEMKWKRDPRRFTSRDLKLKVGVGYQNGRSYSGAVLGLERRLEKENGGAYLRSSHIGAMESQDTHRDGWLSWLIASFSWQWKTKDWIKGENASLSANVGVHVGGSFDGSRRKGSVNVSGDGWLRTSSGVALKVKTSPRSDLTLSSLSYLGAGIAPVVSLYSINTDGKAALRAVTPVLNGTESSATWQNQMRGGSTASVTARLLTTPYGGSTEYGVNLANPKNAVGVSFQDASTIGQKTAFGLLPDGTGDRRIKLSAQKHYSREKTTWRVGINASVPVAGEHTSGPFIRANIRVEPK
jgi:hypothetical protein